VNDTRGAFQQARESIPIEKVTVADLESLHSCAELLVGTA
jgi:hypothetical protein